ncbi:LacI family DNA-binding transcriptional regulator [uncultured Phycicoccus sp.]|uniref:LacI family DNA-binding transcriptional regulator n=1 Tax=uncultured Phycicoccus sp. TaxID=661422 RepID=UPI00260799FD|nr:LacI family DNA-binding transcriptional regulator [uncultured Phycicoccus sp.]
MTRAGGPEAGPARSGGEAAAPDVTLRMVAAHAGVSKSVVSRVLQDSPHVSPARRDAVLAAIEELGYRPNSLARSLTQRRTHIVGVLLHDIRQPWFTDVMEGVSVGLTSAGLLPFIADGRLDRRLDQRVVSSFMDLRLDGLILAGTTPEAPELIDAVARIPSVVLGGRDIRHDRVDVVAQDDLAGAAAAMDHLGALGHRRIHHVAGDLGRGFDLRREAYLAWMRKRRLVRQARIETDETTEAGGYAAARRLLAVPAESRATAIFAGCDAAAVGVLAAVRDAGLAVPEQISVMGFDGTYLGAAQHIRLSTVDTDIVGMGRLAAERLVSRIADPRRAAVETLLVPTVLPRSTTGPAPAG